MNSRDFTNYLKRKFAEFFLETNAIALWRQEFLKALPEIYERVCDDSKNLIREHFPPGSVASGPEHMRWAVERMPNFANTFPRLVNEFTLIRVISLFEVFLTETLRAILSYMPGLPVKGRKKNNCTLDGKLKALEKFDKKLTFFQEQLGISFKDPEFTLECLQEAHEIRNVLVHRNGIVDVRFTQKVPWTNHQEGDRISLSDDFMYKALHGINMAGTHLHRKLAEKYDLIPFSTH
jgi:hypothetical protein